MRIRMITEPIILFETIAMICRYYRGESYSAVAERLSGTFGDGLNQNQINELHHRGALAEQLMNSICADIDFMDEDFAFFFKPFDTGAEPERNCVAKVLVFSMIVLEPMSFDESIEQIKNGWSKVKREGLELLHFHMHGLNFMNANGRHLPSLFEQLYSLNYPYQAKMDSFLAIESHNLYLSKLAKLIRPYAQRLEAALPRLLPVYSAASNYWESSLSAMTNDQVVALMRIEENAKLTKLEKAYSSLFLFNEIGNSFDEISASSPDDITTLYIGMAIYPEYSGVLSEHRIDRIADELKALADPIRIEILTRLCATPDYCLNLAQSMNMNAGNVSRYLSLLHEKGFLIRRKEKGRLYFETDIDAVTRTTRQLLEYIKES